MPTSKILSKLELQYFECVNVGCVLFFSVLIGSNRQRRDQIAKTIYIFVRFIICLASWEASIAHSVDILHTSSNLLSFSDHCSLQRKSDAKNQGCRLSCFEC